MTSEERFPPRSIEALFELWEQLGGVLWAKAETAVLRWVEKLGPAEVEEAIIIAMSKDLSPIDTFRYFCGVCRKRQGELLAAPNEERQPRFQHQRN